MNLKLNSSLSIFEHGYISCLSSFQLKLSVCIHKVLLEGSMSQIFDLGPSFYCMSKNGQLFALFSNITFYIP